MRLPLAVNLESRDGQRDPRDESVSKPRDARIVNGIVEIKGEKAVVRKRPGFVALGQIDTGVGQLLYNWNGIRAIIDDTLSTGTLATVISAPAQDALTVANPDLQFSAANTGSGAATPRMMFKNRSNAFVCNKAGTVSAVTYGGTMGSETINLASVTRSGATVTATYTSTIPFSIGDTVTIAGAVEADYNGSQVITAVTPGEYLPDVAIPITLTRSGTTATATTVGGVPHGLATGTYTIAGANQSAYNGSKAITVTSTTQFTYTVVVTGMATPATGSPAIQTGMPGYSIPGGFTANMSNYAGSDRTQFVASVLTGRELSGGRVLGFAVGISVSITPRFSGSGAISGTYVVTSITTSSNGVNYVDIGIDVNDWGGGYHSADFSGYLIEPVYASVSSITYAGLTATATTGSNHNFNTGDYLTTSGADQDGYNVAQVAITRTGATTFTYPIVTSDTPITPATGSITVTRSGGTTPASFTYTIGATPTTPATGTITAQGSGGTVPGIGYLNGYFVVMDTAGTIWNSAADDPTSWPALNFLIAENDASRGMGVAVSRGYLVAFKEWSTEFFYDAQNASGSPFSPVESGILQTGCANGWSIASIDDVTFWMSQTKAKGRGVHLLSGIEAKKVSTPDIDRILDDADISLVYAYCLKVEGHALYVLTVASDVADSTNEGFTLVYDATSDIWYEWTINAVREQVTEISSITRVGNVATAAYTNTGAKNLADGNWIKISGANQTEYNGVHQAFNVGGGYFSFMVSGEPATPATTGSSFTGSGGVTDRLNLVGAISFENSVLLLDRGGRLMALEDEVYLDDSSLYDDGAIDFVMRTPRFDAGTLDRKTMGSIKLFGTQVNDYAAIRWSDDDYRTVSEYRMVDLNTDEPQLRRCGSFKRRSFELKHVGNSAPIFEALEIDIRK